MQAVKTPYTYETYSAMIMFLGKDPVDHMRCSTLVYTFCACFCTWFLTALGVFRASVLPLSGDERREKVIVGISTGIMCAASFWSLFGPAGEQARSLPGWIKTLPTAGFLCGWGTIYLSSVFLQRDISDKKLSEMYPLYWQSPFTICRRGAIGVAFGVAEMSGRAQNYTEAWLLALGIGLQNIPDGFSVTAPLKKGGATNTENFFGGNCPVWRSG